MSAQRIGVITFPGSCDDADARAAVARAGHEAVALWHGDAELHGVDGVIVPGGFSYGDYLRVGAIARFSPVMGSVAGFAAEGGPVLGICNGFQVLCEAGLLPGALLPNAGLRFLCRQVDVEVVDDATAWTQGTSAGDVLSIPVKHQAGRYFASESQLEAVRVVFRYAAPEEAGEPGGARGNPNGSVNDIAGVASAAGNVVGLMPHPEHAVDVLTGSADGLALFTPARTPAAVGR